MTKEVALEVKQRVLDHITDVIPASVVDQAWNAYLEEFNPANREAPCTCNPKNWLSIINQLRDRVTETLNAEVVTVENQAIVKKEKKQK